ncbi:MAG: ABC transporter permease [Caulobacterales bacterium]|nr:ABC transporter permease [Caulobacterales bacterium]
MSAYRPGPLLPRDEGRDFALFCVVAILCFLATFGAMAAASAQRAAEGWSRAMAAEATVQVNPRPDESGDQAAARAAEVLAGVPGVTETEAMSRTEAEHLLRPWLGEAILPDLPLPHLVVVRLDSENPATGRALGRALAEAGLDARVDDHSVWRADVGRAAWTATLAAMGLAALAALAAAAAVVFACRAALQARAQMVETLSLMGASAGFITSRFQSRFAWLAAVAGAAGGLGACALLAVLIAAGGDQALTPALPFDWSDLILAAPTPVLAAGLAAIAARLTVGRLLQLAYLSETRG